MPLTSPSTFRPTAARSASSSLSTGFLQPRFSRVISTSASPKDLLNARAGAVPPLRWLRSVPGSGVHCVPGADYATWVSQHAKTRTWKSCPATHVSRPTSHHQPPVQPLRCSIACALPLPPCPTRTVQTLLRTCHSPDSERNRHTAVTQDDQAAPGRAFTQSREALTTEGLRRHDGCLLWLEA